MKRILLALTCWLICSGAAYAEQSGTGKQYVDLCAKNKSACDTALIASIKRIEKTKVDGKKIICLPASVGLPEEMSVVKNFIRASPTYLHMNLDALSLGALQAVFSCS